MSFRVASIRSEVHKKIDGNNDKYITYKNDYILLEKMLFDLSIIGVENRENTVSNTYNIAIFEPNRDGRISPNPNDNLFVHPMFIHKINFVRDPEACSKPVCPVQAVSTKKLLS